MVEYGILTVGPAGVNVILSHCIVTLTELGKAEGLTSLYTHELKPNPFAASAVSPATGSSRL